MPDIIDSYERFITRFNIQKEDLFEFGLRETILPPLDQVEKHWEDLKKRIHSNDIVTIRGYGRDAKGTSLYIGLYKYLFDNNNVKKDSTNNAVPHRLIENMTGYKRNKNLLNYQVSHIFGKTKNIYLFEAPWNIALVPKLIDPFTGHESKGIWPKEYQSRFLAFAREKYAQFIEDYNCLITDSIIVNRIQQYIRLLKNQEGETKEILQFERDSLNELCEIELNGNGVSFTGQVQSNVKHNEDSAPINGTSPSNR